MVALRKVVAQRRVTLACLGRRRRTGGHAQDLLPPAGLVQPVFPLHSAVGSDQYLRFGRYICPGFWAPLKIAPCTGATTHRSIESSIMVFFEFAAVISAPRLELLYVSRPKARLSKEFITTATCPLQKIRQSQPA